MAKPTSSRIVALDGLRGVAALTVVTSHVVDSDRRQGAIYLLGQNHNVTLGERLLHFSPLRIVWAGQEAVIIFFVISGLALSMPFANRAKLPDRGEWPVWMYRRAARLYVPAVASLLFAFVTTFIVERRALPGNYIWLNERVSGLSFPHVIAGSSLMGGWGSLNGSLWSLRWEVLFSLLLPLFLWFGAWRRVGPLVKGGALVAVCIAWPLADIFYPKATYLLMFGFGVLMAFNLDKVRALGEKVPSAAWPVIFVAGCVLITLDWTIMGFGPGTTAWTSEIWMTFSALGSVLLVWCSICWTPTSRFFGSRPVGWLGKRSFSLYLVQEPILVGIEFLARGRLPLWVMLLLCLPATLLGSAIFYRFVEGPSHGLARRIGAAPTAGAGPNRPLLRPAAFSQAAQESTTWLPGARPASPPPPAVRVTSRDGDSPTPDETQTVVVQRPPRFGRSPSA